MQSAPTSVLADTPVRWSLKSRLLLRFFSFKKSQRKNSPWSKKHPLPFSLCIFYWLSPFLCFWKGREGAEEMFPIYRYVFALVHGAGWQPSGYGRACMAGLRPDAEVRSHNSGPLLGLRQSTAGIPAPSPRRAGKPGKRAERQSRMAVKRFVQQASAGQGQLVPFKDMVSDPSKRVDPVVDAGVQARGWEPAGCVRFCQQANNHRSVFLFALARYAPPPLLLAGAFCRRLPKSCRSRKAACMATIIRIT